MSGTATPGIVIAQLVETMRALTGPHPGFRLVHAKGIVCASTFHGAPEARRVCRAPHLQGQAVPTVILFSNASGDPEVHDGLTTMADLHRAGAFPFKRLVRFYDFDQINQTVADAQSGGGLKLVLRIA